VETIATTDYTYFPKENIRSKCNQHKVKGCENSKPHCNEHKVRGVVTKQPEHGSTETTTATNYPAYPKGKPPREVGSDELELLVLFPGGFAWEVHYDISVR